MLLDLFEKLIKRKNMKYILTAFITAIITAIIVFAITSQHYKGRYDDLAKKYASSVGLVNAANREISQLKQKYEPTTTETITEVTSIIKATTEVTTEPIPISYSDGMYKVGADIPAGEYIAQADFSKTAYFCISTDANQDDIVANDNFTAQKYFTVSNGQYLELKRCSAHLNQ